MIQNESSLLPRFDDTCSSLLYIPLNARSIRNYGRRKKKKSSHAPNVPGAVARGEMLAVVRDPQATHAVGRVKRGPSFAAAVLVRRAVDRQVLVAQVSEVRVDVQHLEQILRKKGEEKKNGHI